MCVCMLQCNIEYQSNDPILAETTPKGTANIRVLIHKVRMGHCGILLF